MSRRIYFTMLFTFLIVTSINPEITHASDDGEKNSYTIVLQRNDYMEPCTIHVPLWSHEFCDLYGQTGRRAMDCAIEKATQACEMGGNGRCSPVFSRVEHIGLTEDQQFSKCKAEAVVRGFNLVDDVIDGMNP